MKALVIYDATGRIWSIIYGEEEAPQGLLSMFVDIPDGAALSRIDVTDPENPKAVFDYLPESDIGRLQKDMTQAKADIVRIDEKLTKSTCMTDGASSAMVMMAMAFTDEQALLVADLYPLWSDLDDGTTLTKQEEVVTGTEITKVRYGGKLYKVITTHKKQADWFPRQETASLFTVIDEEHAGTKEDPIPYSVNMIVYNGKYYMYNETLYLCTRDSEIALQHTPDQLIGQYFTTA